MKVAILTIIGAFASSAFSQSLTGVPVCAQPCVNNYLSGGAIAGCNGLDAACICSNTGFLSGIACCLVASCNAADQATAVQFAHDICKANGVTNLPASATCTSTSGSTATSSANIAATTGASNATITSSKTGSSITSTAASSSSSAAVTKNAGQAQNVAGMGAGIAGGLAMLALL